MTKRERVIQALTHHDTDIVPYHVDLTGQAWERTAKYLGDDHFTDKIGNHISGVYYSGDGVEIKEGYFKDDFGVIWNKTGVDKDIGVIDNFVIPEPDISVYTFPEVDEARLRKNCEEAMKNRGDTFVFAELGFSLFERAWTLTGMENLLVYMLTEPDFVKALFGKITEFNLKLLKIYGDYDFDGYHFGDDWGQQHGTIMGPGHWRKWIKPSLAEMYAYAHKQSGFVSQHSCGDIHELFPDLIDIGLNVYQTFQPEIYDIKAVKDEFGGKLSFWGGISTQRLLPFETPEGVVKKAKEIMGIMSKNGGYIAAPTHSIPGDVPPENIVALIEMLKNQ